MRTIGFIQNDKQYYNEKEYEQEDEKMKKLGFDLKMCLEAFNNGIYRASFSNYFSEERNAWFFEIFCPTKLKNLYAENQDKYEPHLPIHRHAVRVLDSLV